MTISTPSPGTKRPTGSSTGEGISIVAPAWKAPPRPAPTPPPRTGEKQRILFIDHTATLGGGEIALFNLVMALDKSVVTPIVLLFADDPEGKPGLATRLRLARIQVEIVSLNSGIAAARKDRLGPLSLLNPLNAMRTWAFVSALAQRIRDLNPDIVHTNSLKSDLLGGIAARWAHKPCVWHVRDRIAADYLPRPVAAFFRRAARHIPTHVIAISQCVMETLRWPARLQARATVIHDGIPDPGSVLSPEPRHEVHSDAGLKIGIVGRISPWKGQHVFLEAAALVLRKFPAARFQVIGGALFAEHDYEQRLHTQVERLGLRQAVDFTGFRAPAEIPALIDGLDILVHASTLGEPFGQVIVEGMIAGKAVIATDGGGVPEIISDRAVGLMVPMNHAAALAEAMVELLSDAPRRTAMGRRARQHVLDHFSIGRTAEKVQQVYDALIQINA